MAHTKKPARAYIGTTVSADLKKRLQEIARADHRSLSVTCAIFLAAGVEHRERVAARADETKGN